MKTTETLLEAWERIPEAFEALAVDPRTGENMGEARVKPYENGVLYWDNVNGLTFLTWEECSDFDIVRP